MHSFPLPTVTEDSSKILKKDVVPLQSTHEKHHCSSLSSLFSLLFSCMGVLPPAPSFLFQSFKNDHHLSSCTHILPVWEELLFQFLSLPANLLSSNIASLPYKCPHSGKTLPPQPAMHMAISSSHLDPPKAKHS